MLHPIILLELGRAHQRDLLAEAEVRRRIALARGDNASRLHEFVSGTTAEPGFGFEAFLTNSVEAGVVPASLVAFSFPVLLQPTRASEPESITEAKKHDLCNFDMSTPPK